MIEDADGSEATERGRYDDPRRRGGYDEPSEGGGSRQDPGFDDPEELESDPEWDDPSERGYGEEGEGDESSSSDY